MPLSTIFQLYHGGQFYCGRPGENHRPVTKSPTNFYLDIKYALAFPTVKMHHISA